MPIRFEEIKRRFELEQQHPKVPRRAEDMPPTYESITPEWLTDVLGYSVQAAVNFYTRVRPTLGVIAPEALYARYYASPELDTMPRVPRRNSAVPGSANCCSTTSTSSTPAVGRNCASQTPACATASSCSPRWPGGPVRWDSPPTRLQCSRLRRPLNSSGAWRLSSTSSLRSTVSEPAAMRTCA